MNILHIEQSMLIREMTYDMVTDIGHKYYSAKSAEEAFSILESKEIQFIITGLELADSTGEALMESLLKSDYKEVPAIVLTSRDSLEIRKKLFDLGAVDYIVKDSMTGVKLKAYIEAFEVKDDVINKMRNRSIAVLDDSRLVNTLIKNIFELHGIKNVDVYSEPESLLDSDKEYDIYILDLILPGISGEEVLLQLRKKAHNSIIILISSISHYKTISNILSSGADDFIMKPFDASVFMARIKAHSRNFILREELENANRELAKAAITDGLTQVFNHKYIVDRVKEEMERAKRYGQSVSIFLFDIDNFKGVNDIYGHQIGDEVLRSIAGVMKNLVRGSDCVGRYGGEEFLVILPETDIESAKIVGEKIRTAIEKMTFSQEDLKVTMSGGGVQFIDQTAIELIKTADEGLYQAKHNGKNQNAYVVD